MVRHTSVSRFEATREEAQTFFIVGHIHPSIKHCFKQAMTSHHFLANLLHPVYHGSKLLPDHANTAHELLLETSPDLFSELYVRLFVIT